MRIFDLYLAIKITFIFTLLPYYLTDNEDFAAVKNSRSMEYINKSAGDLTVAFAKVNHINI